MHRSIFLCSVLVNGAVLIFPIHAGLFDKLPSFSDVIFSNKCIEDLGCFYSGPPFFDPLYRPISVAPSEELHTKFLLYTRSNPDEEYDLEISRESLQRSPFKSNLPTKILIHGFRSDLGEEDIRHSIKKSLLIHGNYNVIVVDWTKDNGLPYTKAVANARPTGAKIAKLVNFLIKYKGISAKSVHLIAHSLGAHIAGYVGERVANLGRITGLDPAGPYFTNTDSEVRLDPSDAIFVDIIHTDAQDSLLFGNGYPTPIGHLDFYPNGGNTQPGCIYASESKSLIGRAVKSTTSMFSHPCDHERANLYFLESLESNCTFLGVRCDSYKDYENGLCSPKNSTVAEMGFRATKIPRLTDSVKFFLKTESEPPFCINQIIEFSKARNSSKPTN